MQLLYILQYQSLCLLEYPHKNLDKLVYTGFKQNIEKDINSNQTISIIDKHEQTPSTLSSIDSMKLNIENEYPKIIGEKNNGEILFILA